MTKTIDQLVLKVVGLIFLTLISNYSWSQTSVGSVYSIFGIGELQPQASIQSSGMGFTSIALNSPYWANTVNPAANTNVGGSYYTHIFDFGIYYKNINYEKIASSESLGDGGISHLSYWFRFNRKWTGIVGITPFSKVGYNITDNSITTGEGYTYSVNYKGSGGLTKVYFGQGYEVLKNFTLGFSISYIMGNLRHEQYITGTNNSTTFVVVNQTSLHKFDFDFSANYTINLKNAQFNLGAIYNRKRELSGTTNKTLTDPNVELLYDESEEASSYTLPEKIGAGVSFMNDKLIVSGDVEFNRWSEAIIDDSDRSLNDTWRYAAGVEYTPNREGKGLAKLSYRLGAFTENSYLTIEDSTFPKQGATIGLGVPFKSNGVMNLSYLLQKNGTISNNLILESTHKVTLAFSIRNSWFKRGKYQ